MTSWEPHLSQVRHLVTFEPLPQRRSEGTPGLVEGQGLESVLDLTGDLGIGELPLLG